MFLQIQLGFLNPFLIEILTIKDIKKVTKKGKDEKDSVHQNHLCFLDHILIQLWSARKQNTVSSCKKKKSEIRVKRMRKNSS